MLTLLLAALAPGPLLAQQPAGPRDLPNPQATPGDVTGATREQLCVPGYQPNPPPPSVRTQVLVLQAYGMDGAQPGSYMLNYLIPPTLGGSSAITNLWPMATDAEPYNPRVKYRLEQKLLEMVCSGRITLAAAQQAIARNWVDAYWNYVGE